MPLRLTVRHATLTLAALALAACAKKSDVAATDSATDSAAPPAAPAVAAPAASTTASGGDVAAPLTAGDVDRWAKGMAAEREAVLAAGEKVKAAKTGDDSASAMGGVLESATLDVAARAAGVSGDRWRTIRSTLSAAAPAWAPLSVDMDTTKMGAEMIKTFRDNATADRTRFAQTLPKDVVDALAPRAGELRKQDLELTSLRAKASGMR